MTSGGGVRGGGGCPRWPRRKGRWWPEAYGPAAVVGDPGGVAAAVNMARHTSRRELSVGAR
jgi:hypothetical protein